MNKKVEFYLIGEVKEEEIYYHDMDNLNENDAKMSYFILFINNLKKSEIKISIKLYKFISLFYETGQFYRINECFKRS